MVKNPPASAEAVGDAGSIPGLGRSPREGNGNPLQYSCLENPMDRGAWWVTVHRVPKELDMTEATEHRDQVWVLEMVRHVAKSSYYLSWQWADQNMWGEPSQTIQPQPGQPPFRSPTQSNHEPWEITHADGLTPLPLEWFGTQKKLKNAPRKC